MTFTVTLAELSLFIVAIAFLILAVLAIPVLVQLRQAIRAIQELSVEGKRFLEEANSIAHKVDGQVGELEEAIKKVKDVSLKTADVVETLVDAIKGPVVTLAGLIAGIALGINHYRKGGDEDVGK